MGDARRAHADSDRPPRSGVAKAGNIMDVVYERWCGLDVHKRTVVACLLTPGPQGQPRKAVRTFGTMTGDVLALAEWLAAAGCSHVAMEGTGVYWQPIWNLL